ncbi:MAG: YcxB family protein [Lachnospiraceae bacterium]|nr:YcxB family protein [Lachnospiraceae bacterium]
MKDRYEFDISMRVSDMRAFMFYSNYRGFSGWFGVILSLAALGLLIANFSSYDTGARLVLGFLAALFTIVNPLMILMKAPQTVKLNPVYKKPLHYVLDEGGITISQDETDQSIEWSTGYKLIIKKNAYYLFTAKRFAFIFPKDELGGEAEEIREYIEKHIGVC